MALVNTALPSYNIKTVFWDALSKCKMLRRWGEVRRWLGQGHREPSHSQKLRSNSVLGLLSPHSTTTSPQSLCSGKTTHESASMQGQGQRWGMGGHGLYTRSNLTEVPASSNILTRDGQPENLNKLLNSSKKVLVGISWNLCTNLREMVVLVVGKLLVSKHSFSPCIWELRKYIGSLFIVKCIPVFLFYLLCVCYLIWAFFPLYFLLNIVGIYGTSWVYNFILPPPLYWFFICSKLF